MNKIENGRLVDVKVIEMTAEQLKESGNDE